MARGASGPARIGGYASRLHNRLTSMIVGVPMHDYGCMLRAYRRHIVDTVVECDEKAAFVPALANTFAKRVAEIRGRARRSRERRVEVQSLQSGEAQPQSDHRVFADSDPDAEHDRDRDFGARPCCLRSCCWRIA